MTIAEQAIINSIDNGAIASVPIASGATEELAAWCRTSEVVNTNDVFYYGPIAADGSSVWVVLAEAS